MDNAAACPTGTQGATQSSALTLDFDSVHEATC